MRIFVALCILCSVIGVLLCISVPPAFAHAGPGPPFLKVDDEYALSNVYFSGSSDIIVPQDLIFQKHLVNTPIRFTVDTSKLLVPPEIAKASAFRWTFEEGSQQHAFGETVIHTYTKPKSYLVTLEVKSPDQPDFMVIDTVQVNVLPKENYQLPKAVISVETDHMQITRPIIFESTSSTVEPSTAIAKVQWDLGDGTESTDAKVEHTYSNFDNYISYAVVLRVIDANGFISDTGVIVDSNKGQLVFVDKNNKKNTIAIATTLSVIPSKPAAKSSSGMLYGIGFVIGIILLALLITISQRKRTRKKML